MKGFLGTWASFSADLNLLIQVAMGVALLVGTFLARAKRYAAHGACQAVVLMLILPVIALVMWPSLHVRVLPQLSRHFGKRYYAFATAHGVLGALAEVLLCIFCWSLEPTSFLSRGAFSAGSCGCGLS